MKRFIVTNFAETEPDPSCETQLMTGENIEEIIDCVGGEETMEQDGIGVQELDPAKLRQMFENHLKTLDWDNDEVLCQAYKFIQNTSGEDPVL